MTAATCSDCGCRRVDCRCGMKCECICHSVEEPDTRSPALLATPQSVLNARVEEWARNG